MAKIELNNVTSGYNLAAINENFQLIEQELKQKVVYRDEVSPMERPLDMNSERILNLPNAVNPSEPVTLRQLSEAVASADKLTGVFKYEPPITNGQTVVSTNYSYTPYSNNLKVFVNGALYTSPDDYTETSNTSVTFTAPLTSSDKVVFFIGDVVNNTNIDPTIRPELAAPTGAEIVGTTAPAPGAVLRTVASKLREFVSVKDFGAVGDGVHDDAPAFQAAVDYVQGKGGGAVFVPTGVYLMGSGVTITRGGVTIYGEGFEEFAGVFGSTTPHQRGIGTWLYWSFNSSPLFTLSNGTSNGVTIRNLGFDCPKNPIAPGWTPPDQPPAIYTGAGPCLLEDLYFFGVSRGIQIGAIGTATGRTTLNRVKGEFFAYGVDIVFAADVVRITNYHQYCFWSHSENPVRDYTKANTYGIRMARNDNPQLVNVFIGGVYRGLYVYTNVHGFTSKLMVVNMDCDFTHTGYLFDTSNVTAYMVNVKSQPGPDPAMTLSTGLTITGNNNRINIVNFSAARTNRECVEVGGTNNLVSFTNLDVNNWDDQQTGTRGVIRSDSATNKIHLSGLIHAVHANPGAAGPLLTGATESVRWTEAAVGAVTAQNLNASSDIVVTHNLGFTPRYAKVESRSLFAFVLVPHSRTATTFSVRFYDAATGAPAAPGSVVSFDWSLSM